MEIKNEKVVPFIGVKKILNQKAKEKSLSYEQKNTLEYLRKFYKFSEKSVNQLINELKKIEKLNDRLIINIVNLLPQDLDDLRLLFANERVVLTEEEKKQILNVVKEFSKEK